MADGRIRSVDVHVDGAFCAPIWDHGSVSAASTWASTLRKSRPRLSKGL
jgi:hypothetical protein